MGLCELSGDNVVFVTATYIIALAPWSVLSFWDPINRNWTPYWKVFWKSWLYLFLSILPYCILVPYAILQGCSEDSDIKELLTAIVTIFVNLWNLRRAVRGLLALQEIRRIWDQIHIREVALAFADWLPEQQTTPNLELFKLPVVDVLISHSLVDNDWPGEAPQTGYIWHPSLPERNDIYLPSVRAVNSDLLQKRCILTLWGLWMVHASRPYGLLYDETSMDLPRYKCLRKCVHYLLGNKEQLGVPMTSSLGSRTLSSRDNWYRNCLQRITSNKTQQNAQPITSSVGSRTLSSRDNWFRNCLQRIVGNKNQQNARAMIASEDSQIFQTEWMCPACNNETLGSLERNPCAWCALRPLLTRAVGVYVGDEGYSTIFEFELLKQVSNLPSHVQGKLKPSDGARILHFYKYHYWLDWRNQRRAKRENVQDKRDPRCPASRMGLVLGLSKLYDDSVDQWLRSSVERDEGSLSDRLEISTDDMNGKFLSFAVLLAAQRNPSELFLLITRAADESVSWSSGRHLRRVSRIVRTIRRLLHSDPIMEPLNVFQGRCQERWNALFSNVLGEDWREGSMRSEWNAAVRKELRMLSRILGEKAIPSDCGDELRFLPCCVAYGFKDVKGGPISFYNNNVHAVVPANNTILRYHDCWETREDNRKIVWRGRGIGDQTEAGIYAEAKFEVLAVGQVWKAGLAFRFPYWTTQGWPNRNYGGIDFVISVRDKETSSLVFQSENLRVFHFSHFADPRSGKGDGQQIFPLETIYVLPLDDVHQVVRRFMPRAPSHPDDHSYWRLLECRGIPTSRRGPSVISLSLKSRWDSRPPFDNDLELDSFWIAKQTEFSRIEPSSWRTLSAMQKKENW